MLVTEVGLLPTIYIFFDVHFKFHILEMSRLGIQMLLANNSD